MATVFGKGSPLNCGFDLGSNELLDHRCFVETLEDLKAFPMKLEGRTEGLIVYCKETKLCYYYDGSDYVPITGDEGDSQVFIDAFNEVYPNNI